MIRPDMRNDARLNALTDAEFRVWFRLLCLAAENGGAVKTGNTGVLAAESAGGDDKLLKVTVNRLKSLELVSLTDGLITFPGFGKPQKKENIPYAEIVDYLNQQAGTKYRAQTRGTRECIRARWKEGYRLEDFQRVIDKKVTDWGNDPKMCKFIRPQTLFGTKFEGYLNQLQATPGGQLPRAFASIQDWAYEGRELVEH